MKKHISGILITLIFAIIAVFFDYALIRSQFLPGKLTLLVTVLLVLLLLAVFLLLWNKDKKILFITGCILALIFSVGFLFAGSALFDVIETLDNITSAKSEYSNVVVYVKNEDPAQTIEDTRNYTFGILETMDRENTDKAVTDLQNTLGENITIRTYPTLTALADGFAGGECNAIILNTAIMDLFSDVGRYATLPSSVRQLSAVKIEQAPTVPVVTTVPQEPEVTEPEEDEFKPFVVYISGIDSYGSISTRSRSDVNILAIVNPNTHQILLVSTPRDYYVKLPNVSGDYLDKLTHAGIYGINCSVDTLSALYDVPVNYYFQVNFSGFEEIINALGGIVIHSDYEFWTMHRDYYFMVGDNFVGGQQALDFARERNAFPTGDLQRGRNQMEVIRAVIKKVLSPAILSCYTDLLASLEGSFATSIPYDVIAQLVQKQLTEGGNWEIVTYNVTGEGDSRTTFSLDELVYVLIPDMNTVDYAKNLIRQVLDGEIVSVD